MKRYIIGFIIGALIGGGLLFVLIHNDGEFIEREREEIKKITDEVEKRDDIRKVKTDETAKKIDSIEKEIDREMTTIQTIYIPVPGKTIDTSIKDEVIDRQRRVIQLQEKRHQILIADYRDLQEDYNHLKLSYDQVVGKWEVLANRKIRRKLFNWGIGLFGGKNLTGKGFCVSAGVYVGISLRR